MIEFIKKALTSSERDSLSASDFVFPDDRRYPIHDESHARNALSRVAQNGTPAEQAKVRAAVHSKYPNIGESTSKAEDMHIEVDIFKAEKEGKVYGVVLEPDLEDAQGDVVGAEEIEKAAHDFMVASRLAGVQHAGEAVGADLIENYIAPQDLELAGQHVTKGSWVQGWQINDPVVKQEVADGKLTGLSIEGSGVRVPVAA